jgi:hypothetical protein
MKISKNTVLNDQFQIIRINMGELYKIIHLKVTSLHFSLLPHHKRHLPQVSMKDSPGNWNSRFLRRAKKPFFWRHLTFGVMPQTLNRVLHPGKGI